MVEVAEILKRYWGFETLRPLQHEAIRAGMAQRDSLVVMPTGGGKSLCYQVPPLLAKRMDVVVSPLISLMKDQVDGLVECGYPAAAIHSNLSPELRSDVLDRVIGGQVRLLFVSPERLLSPRFLDTLQRVGVQAFAIDEAHCISHWGHDFRQEYRQLSTLKTLFPRASMHAFTATATPRVQHDIVQQLQLEQPDVLVGRFDRPNLTYRIVPRLDLRQQVLQVVRRHQDEALICYCITRAETEKIAGFLQGKQVKAAAYHAGMAPDDRRRVQEAFAQERLDVVVATVAFGMGIDRSNVRCVLHAGMPKSIEHYQQETGRAGRDGLEAECVLLYSAADVIRWRQIIERNGNGARDLDDEPDADSPIPRAGAQLDLLRHMQGVCCTLQCRHRALSRYFGQDYDAGNCGACDVCLDEVEAMDDSTVVAQKILSCVARVGQRFGVSHVVDVLRGSANTRIGQIGHDHLSTFGLLRELPDKALTNLVYQLVDHGLLTRTDGDRPVLQLTADARPVLRGQREVKLLRPQTTIAVKQTRAETDGWEGVDRDLFELLREVRATIAKQRGVPAYVIFGDKSLRAMASIKPTSDERLREVYGVGDKKLADFGATFIQVITQYCAHDDSPRA